MLNTNFEKIFNLSKKTGDKFIVLPEFGDPFVIIPFRDYEKILNFTPDITNLTEEELLDKINRDIAIWKDSQKDFNSDWLPDSFSANDLYENDSPLGEEDDKTWENPLTKDPFAYEPIKPWLEDEITDENLEDEYSFAQNAKFDLEKKITESEEPVKYENIPPPPDLNQSAIIPETPAPTPIIDLSFDDNGKVGESTAKEDEFSEEPVY